MQVNCPVCGKEFKVKPSHYFQSICCSLQCGNAKRRSNWDKRFWMKVKKTDTCWLWIASTRGNPSYGQFRHGNENLAHRVSWIMANGPIPEGMQICHNCPGGDNPLCVNPAHLWLGTRKQNAEDAVAKGRYNFGNTVPYERRPRGSRHHKAKITEQDVVEMCRAYHGKQVTKHELVARYKLSFAQVYRILNGLSWKHVKVNESR